MWVGVVLAISGVLAASGAIGAAAPKRSVMSAIASQARKQARLNAEPRPRDVRAVLTTRRKASKIGCECQRAGGDQAIYVIAMRGRFISDGSRPPGTQAPTGTVLVLVLDAHTLELTDLAITRRYPKLAESGTVFRLAASSQSARPIRAGPTNSPVRHALASRMLA